MLTDDPEIAEALQEAAARTQRKEVRKDTKDLKKDKTVKDYLAGKLDKAEGKKVYNDMQKNLKELLETVSKIPAETTGEKIWGYFRSQYTLSGYVKYLAISVLGNAVFGGAQQTAMMTGKFILSAIIGLTGSAAITAADIAAYNTERKVDDGSGEKNWNKAYALKTVKKLQNKVEEAYNKYYKD